MQLPVLVVTAVRVLHQPLRVLLLVEVVVAVEAHLLLWVKLLAQVERVAEVMARLAELLLLEL